MSAPIRSIRAALALAVAASTALPMTAPAQGGGGGLIGHIFDEKTNEAILDALILVDSVRRDVGISSQGRFVVLGLRPGVHRIEVRAVGYRPHVLDVTLLDKQVLERDFGMLFTGDRLPEVRVEARNSKLLPRFADFERRRTKGFGAYITRDDIREKGYMNLGDAVRSVQGVRVDCGVVECVIHMARATAGCFPTFYVDGRLARSFAESTAITDIQGIEVYRGAAEMPAEFSGSGSMCGVIAIWTRAAP